MYTIKTEKEREQRMTGGVALLARETRRKAVQEATKKDDVRVMKRNSIRPDTDRPSDLQLRRVRPAPVSTFSRVPRLQSVSNCSIRVTRLEGTKTLVASKRLFVSSARQGNAWALPSHLHRRRQPFNCKGSDYCDVHRPNISKIRRPRSMQQP